MIESVYGRSGLPNLSNVIDPAVAHDISKEHKAAVFSYLYGSDIPILDLIDEEGCGSVILAARLAHAEQSAKRYPVTYIEFVPGTLFR